MIVKSVDETLCVLPLRLFLDGEPTVFQDGDVMIYDFVTSCLRFDRCGHNLLYGEASGDAKVYIPQLNDDQFGTFGMILSKLFGFGTFGVMGKWGDLWFWNFRS